MKEFVEKLIKTFKCEELRTDFIAVGDVISIVNQLAEEYNQGWIPVTERLPKPGKRYLVTAVWKDGDFETHSIYTFVYGTDELWHSYNYEPVSHCEVIAWMPLPEPYKPEEKPKFSNEELDAIMDKILDSNQEPKTRIEHIRSMSVEEMADVILESDEISTVINFCQNLCGECENIPESECRECLIKYLNSPVEQ